jgi:hypothetical protein
MRSPLVQRLNPLGEAPHYREMEAVVFCLTRATLPGTGDAILANPVASSSSVEPSQRAERSGP